MMLLKNTAVVLSVVAIFGTACCPTSQCDALQEELDALEQRVADFELWASGGRDPVAVTRPDPTDEDFKSMAEWLVDAAEAICGLESVVATAPEETLLCPGGTGDPTGDPPPPPPFIM